MKIAGEAVYVDAAGVRHSIEGFGSLPDADELQKLDVSGEFSFGKISCDDVKISGSCDGKVLTAKNVSAQGNFSVDSADVAENFKFGGSAKVETLRAKKVAIESRGGAIGSINCVELKIFHDEIHKVGGSVFSKIFGSKVSRPSNSRVRIKNIEADTVALENCAVDVIHCKDAHIGKNCTVEKLFVSGECNVAADSTVGETIHE